MNKDMYTVIDTRDFSPHSSYWAVPTWGVLVGHYWHVKFKGPSCVSSWAGHGCGPVPVTQSLPEQRHPG